MASSREEMLEMALRLYVGAHGFNLGSEGYEDEDARRTVSRRYRLAREALNWGMDEAPPAPGEDGDHHG